MNDGTDDLRKSVDDPDDDIPFVRPPETIVFRPTEAEFNNDPLAYIASVQHIAENYGICKIIPPKTWKPPFAANLRDFKFVPRVQRVNELEATTRIKLNFLNNIARFIEMQGSVLRVPVVERKYLDIYKLHRVVALEGGFEKCCSERGRWKRVAMRMGSTAEQAQHSSAIYKQHYERLLYPYDVFKSGVYEENGIENVTQSGRSARYTRRNQTASGDRPEKAGDAEPADLSDDCKKTGSRELKRLATTLKTASPTVSPTKSESTETVIAEDPLPSNTITRYKACSRKGLVSKTENSISVPNGNANLAPLSDSSKTLCSSPDDSAFKSQNVNVTACAQSSSVPPEAIQCFTCCRGDGEDQLLLCDTCDNAYHTYCLLPPLPDVPRGDWCCPKCVNKELNKPLDPYGFVQSSRQYTLKTFGEMADSFKANYFRLPITEIKPEQVEREFWRLTKSIHEQVQVEYGADVHVLEMGSGFPVGDNRHFFPGEEKYADSPWNLNNLPLLPHSLLRFVTAEISGMKIPWCYVGMCFSCFCWHVEDHYTYSINYLHWGDPKTWYGVPSTDADKLEKVMMSKAPELFEQSPDLLHQLTTVINPSLLQKHGVTVHRCDQEPGQFVVTFPRAYHAGFNNGYNFAEAVNFCLPDWLPFGRACIENYRKARRYCVFSQEELLCKMAANPSLLDVGLAAKLLSELNLLIEDEHRLRKITFETGVTESIREMFEVIRDEDRQCFICKTTCFLSAIVCSCNSKVMVCLRHLDNLPCSCDNDKRCLHYRYTFDDLNYFVEGVKKRSEVFNSWLDRTTAALAPISFQPVGQVDLVELKTLAKEAIEKHLPERHELQMALKKVIADADKAARSVHQLLTQVNRTKTRHGNAAVHQVTIDELKNFVEQYASLPYQVPGLDEVVELEKAASRFVTEVDLLMSDPDPLPADLHRLQRFSQNYDIQLPGVAKLTTVIERFEWLQEYKTEFSSYLKKQQRASSGAGNNDGLISDDNVECDDDVESVSLETVEKLINSSRKIIPNAEMSSAIRHLQDLASFGEHLEHQCKNLLTANPKRPLAEAGDLIMRGSAVSVLHVTALKNLKDAVKRAASWAEKLEKLVSTTNNGASFPLYLEAQHVVEVAKTLPFKLDGIDRTEAQVTAAGAFLEKTARVFLNRNRQNTELLDILSPRTDIGHIVTQDDLPPRKAISSSSPLSAFRKNRLSASRKVESLVVTCVPKIDFSDNTTSSSELYSRYTEASKLEVEAIIELRIANVEKLRRNQQSESKDIGLPEAGGDPKVAMENSANAKLTIAVCVCRKGPTTNMNVCALCKEWFHSGCVSVPKLSNSSSSASNSSLLLKFLCPSCCRSKRPKVDNVLALLLSLQRINLRIQEGDALQFLAERVISWQQRVRKYLSSTAQLSTAVSTLKQHGADSTNFRDAVNALTLISDDGDFVLAHLERLYVEGELIEVTLEEIGTLWAILNVARPPVRPPTPDQATEAMMLTLQEHTPSNKKPTVGSSKQKTGSNKAAISDKSVNPTSPAKTHDGLSSSRRPASSGVQMLMQALAKASRKRRAEEASLVRMEASLAKKLGTKGNSSAVSGSSNSKAKSKANSQRKRASSTASSGSASRSKPSRLASNRNTTSSEENSSSAREWSDEDCSADKCIKPVGDDVNWVQCDNCQLWYHTECLGLGNRIFSEDEKFYCYRCPQSSSLVNKSGTEEKVIEESVAEVDPNFDAELVRSTAIHSHTEEVVTLTEQDVTKIDLDQHVASINTADLNRIFSGPGSAQTDEDIAIVMQEAESTAATEPSSESRVDQQQRDVSDILASLSSTSCPN